MEESTETQEETTSGLAPEPEEVEAVTDVTEDAEDGESAPQEAEEADPVESTEEDVEAEEPKKPEKSKVQRRIDRITKEKYEAEERAQRAEEERERLKKELAEKLGGRPDLPPQQEDFDNFDDFAEALSDYKADQKYQAVRADEAKKAQAQAEEARWKLLDAQFEQGRAKYEDFDKVARANPMEGGPTITKTMLDAMQSSDIMPDVAYHLGKNVEEANRIANLPFVEQIKAMAYVEMEVRQAQSPKPKKVTKAPTPIRPVGSSAVVEKSVSDMTDAEYAEWRRKGR